jgi:hypothetical protein
MLHKLISIPLRGVITLAEKIREEVDKELYSVSYIQQQLVLLNTLYEMGELEESLFLMQEEEVLYRLELAKEREWELLLSDEDNSNEDEAEEEEDSEEADESTEDQVE